MTYPLHRSLLCLLPWLAACAGGAKPAAAPAPAPAPAVRQVVVHDTVVVRDSEQDQQVARLQIQLYEKEAQLEELQGRLDDARRDVVRAMAKLQTLASRAEAASGMAEAELAVQSLKAAAGGTAADEASDLLKQSTAEFNKQNFGGALYLANQAKWVAGQGKSRLAQVDRSTRPGETLLAVPVRLQAVGRSNVREGPGTRYSVQFTLESGAALTGLAYADDWVRVRDDSGRTGWVFQSLVSRQGESTR